MTPSARALATQLRGAPKGRATRHFSVRARPAIRSTRRCRVDADDHFPIHNFALLHNLPIDVLGYDRSSGRVL
jgi:hypothetical protein